MRVKITSGTRPNLRATHSPRTMNSTHSTPRTSPSGTGRNTPPWQLGMFSRSLKKQQKLALLREQIGEARDRKCLLVTHGDNNGALNHHLRAHGGRWTWVENESKQITEMEGLLGEPVLREIPLEYRLTTSPSTSQSASMYTNISMTRKASIGSSTGPFAQVER